MFVGLFQLGSPFYTGSHDPGTPKKMKNIWIKLKDCLPSVWMFPLLAVFEGHATPRSFDTEQFDSLHFDRRRNICRTRPEQPTSASPLRREWESIFPVSCRSFAFKTGANTHQKTQSSHQLHQTFDHHEALCRDDKTIHSREHQHHQGRYRHDKSLIKRHLWLETLSEKRKTSRFNGTVCWSAMETVFPSLPQGRCFKQRFQLIVIR